MNNVSRTLSAAQCTLVSRARRLRASIWTHHYNLGAEFSRELARGWAERGLAGMAAACWDISQILAAEETIDMATYTEAHDLAAALATA